MDGRIEYNWTFWFLLQDVHHEQQSTYSVEAFHDFIAARYGAVPWIDSQDNLWVFGGYDGTGKWYDDVWMFNTTNLLWLWISGANSATTQLPIWGTLGKGNLHVHFPQGVT